MIPRLSQRVGILPGISARAFVVLVTTLVLGQDNGSQPATNQSSGSNGEDIAPEMTDAQAFLYERIQRLENALWALTGKVEELEYKLESLSDQQLNSYRDLDRRILALNQPEDRNSIQETELPEGDSEQELYRRAFGLLERQDFDESLAGFEELTEKYPNGQYVAESWYWQGELHLKSDPPNLESARQKFVQLITWYPDDRRAPEAMFKLGSVYQQLGDDKKAKEHLQRVVDEYPDSNVAKIAREYYKELE